MYNADFNWFYFAIFSWCCFFIDFICHYCIVVGNNSYLNGARMGRKKNQLGTQIYQLKKNNDKIFSALASTASRLDAVERVQADADMRVRNLEIKMKSMSGAKNKDIAVEYDLSEGRVSQIINQ